MGRHVILLAPMCVLSLLSGFAESALLYLIVRAATAIATGDRHVTVSLGFLHRVGLTVDGLFLAAGAVILFLFVLSTGSAWCVARLSTATVTRARKITLAAYVRAEWSVQAQEPEGQLQQLLAAYTTRVGQGMMQVAAGIVAGLNFLAFVAPSLIIDVRAALVVAVGVIIMSVFLAPLTRATRRLSKVNMQKVSAYALQVSEAVTLSREIKTFDVADRVVDRANRVADEAEISGHRVRLLQRLTPNIYQYVAIGFVLLGLVAVYNLSHSGSVANLGAIVLLLVRALSYAQQVSTAMQQASQVTPYLEEVDDMRRRYERAAAVNGSRPLPRVDLLSFENASYSYLPGHPVLHEISFAVERGEMIGIVGPSGSGKSTLVQLLLGLRSCDSGRYLVNGVPAEEYDRRAWCQRFVLVPQDNKLLRGDVTENIEFFRQGLASDDVVRAARQASVHDELLALPDGYRTMLGSGAMDISGGQRQRVGIARAMAGKPSVLVLDEPTSALDMRSEQVIQQTLERLRGELTVFIVAHRLSTLSLCNRILVLDAGRLAAFGTQEELSTSNAFFSEARRLSRLPA